jgi:hypothetical protein
VGQEELGDTVAYFWLDGVPYILVHDDKCCPKAIDLFLAHILALFLAHGPGDVLHFYQLFLFLKVVLKLILAITDQYQFLLYFQSYLKTCSTRA